MREFRKPPGGRRPGQSPGHRKLLRAGGRRTPEADQLYLQRGHRDLVEFQLCHCRSTDCNGKERSVRGFQGPVGRRHRDFERAWADPAGAPCRTPSVGVLYTDPISGERARQLFENIMRQRLDRFGVNANFVLACTEDENSVARCLQHLLRSKPCVILVASTTAPAGPEDVIGQAMLKVGCQVERFLAPVEPGNLLLMSYKDEVPIISAPGCFRSAKPNVVDLVLPPLLARYHVTGWEVACLGHGGLLA